MEVPRDRTHCRETQLLTICGGTDSSSSSAASLLRTLRGAQRATEGEPGGSSLGGSALPSFPTVFPWEVKFRRPSGPAVWLIQSVHTESVEALNSGVSASPSFPHLHQMGSWDCVIGRSSRVSFPSCLAWAHGLPGPDICKASPGDASRMPRCMGLVAPLGDEGTKRPRAEWSPAKTTQG